MKNLNFITVSLITMITIGISVESIAQLSSDTSFLKEMVVTASKLPQQKGNITQKLKSLLQGISTILFYQIEIYAKH